MRTLFSLIFIKKQRQRIIRKRKGESVYFNNRSAYYQSEIFMENTTIKPSKVYIGTNCGEEIEDQIQNACKSIKIMSPYVSEEKLDLLLKAQEKGVDVTLVTTNSFEDRNAGKYKNDLFRKFIKIYPYVDEDKQYFKKKWIFYNFLGILILVGLVIAGFSETIQILNNIWVQIFIGILIVNRLFRIKALSEINVNSAKFEKAFKKIKLCNVNFTGARTNFKTIHSKIYVIDSKAAYLGSMNFTNSGFRDNYETRIKIEDIRDIGRFSRLIDEIYLSSIPSRNLDESAVRNKLGRRAYKEQFS